MAEILYPRDLIRRTYRAICEEQEPQDIDHVIEMVDVEAALGRMPDQYQRALRAWHEYDGTEIEVAMDLHMEPGEAKKTVKAAWDFLYTKLNTPPRK